MTDQTSEKPTTDEIQDDLESFDELEKNFHKVVQDLSNDHSLDGFRGEYEILHQALTKSQENNQTLIEKCKALNNEILANANKVSSVMNLSQNDQRTIAGLRHEFDKAWKMVELSQDRENKSREVVETLKQEVSNLSRLAEQGGALAFTQETSLQEIADSIADLKKEVAVQAVQVETMTKDVAESQKSEKEIKEKLAVLQNELSAAEETMSTEKDSVQNISKSVDTTHADIAAVKSTYDDLQKVIKANKSKKRAKKQNIDQLNQDLSDYNRDIRLAKDEKKMNLQAVRTVQKVLEDKIKMNGKVEEVMKTYDEKFADKDDKLNYYTLKLKGIQEEGETSKAELEEFKVEQKEVASEKANVRQQLADSRQKLYLLSTQDIMTASRNKGVERDAERRRTELQVVKDKNLQERQETKVVESQGQVVMSEIVIMKAGIHEQRKKVVTISEEITKYENRTSDSHSNHIQIIEDIKSRNEKIDEYKIELSKINAHIKRQDAILESIKNERDLSCRQLESALKENETITDENKSLSMEIKSLKNDIREKDQLCLETHITSKNVLASLSSLTREIESLKVKIKETDEQATEYRNKIQRSLYLINQAELDTLKQKQVVTDLTFSQFGLNSSVTRQTSEIDVIKEKIATVQSLLAMGNIAYKKQLEVNKELKEQLMVEVEKQKKLLSRIQHRKALQFELIRIQKSLLTENGKCKALEEELEKPMNVHRWRFLEGANPELSQLLRMTHELRDRLMMKIMVDEQLRDAKKKWQEKSKTLEGHFSNCYAGSIHDELAFFNNILKQKQTQLAEIQSQVNEQQTSVTQQKDQVMTIRHMVREEKTEYYDSKKKIEHIRSTTAMDRRIKNQQLASMQEPKYIGGGFAVGGVAKQDLALINNNISMSPSVRLTGTRSVLATPHIVHPKSALSQVKKIPKKGWNPKREPMKPFLPTVSQLS